MRLLYIGDSWLGSTARSLKEALARYSGVLIDEVSPNHFVPSAQSRLMRAANRLLAARQRLELQTRVLDQAANFRPDRIVFYKGVEFDAGFLEQLRKSFAPVVNIFPDCSPHAHGAQLARAMGVYDLVASTKVFHPPLWQSTYGYANRCVFVPHGYDPNLHLRFDPPSDFTFDVMLVANSRPQYRELIKGIARHLGGYDVRIALAGPNWEVLHGSVPDSCHFLGPRMGMPYVEVVRKSRILIAPVHTEMIVNGQRQPGDVDTSRTYELAAAHCFFIHRRTDFVKGLYDERTEVPMYDGVLDLADKIRYYLDNPAERTEMAAAAHRRAVPAYSFDTRAAELLRHLEAL